MMEQGKDFKRFRYCGRLQSKNKKAQVIGNQS